MMAMADAFARTNATQFINIVHAYDQVERAALGTPFETKAQMKLDEAQSRHMLAVIKLIAEIEGQIAEKAKQGDYSGAIDAARNYPGDMYVPEPQLGDRINEALRRHLPPGFRAKEQ